MRKWRWLAAVFLAVCTLAACGSSGDAVTGSSAGAAAGGQSVSSTASDQEQSENDTDIGSESPGTTMSTDTPAEVSDAENSEVTGTMNVTVREMYIPRDNMRIFGRLYMPENVSGKAPLVILSHGFGGNCTINEDYAENFASNGIPAFAYDFIGGGYGSRSDGDMTDMSVLTEAKDLDTVLDYFRSGGEFDPGRIFLMGESQGGFVSTYVAGKRPDDVAGLVNLYPAYVLQDDSKKRNPDPENGPDTSSIMGMTVGRIYDVDAQSFDIYDVMKDYPKKVLIVHGTSDSIVPISYSERAAKTFPDAEFHRIRGAGHGFYGSAKEKAAAWALQFVRGLL